MSPVRHAHWYSRLERHGGLAEPGEQEGQFTQPRIQNVTLFETGQ